MGEIEYLPTNIPEEPKYCYFAQPTALRSRMTVTRI